MATGRRRSSLKLIAAKITLDFSQKTTIIPIMDIQVVKNYLFENIDWEMMFSTVDTLGSNMNAQKDRFDKSDLLEQGMEVFSDGKIKWENRNGADHIIPALESVTMEMKFAASSLYTSANLKKRKTISLKLMNTQGANKYTDLPANYAKFIFAMDRSAAMIIETEKVKPYLTYPNDGIVAKVPNDLFTEVVGPSNTITRQKLENYDYKAEKIKFQRAFLMLIRNDVQNKRNLRLNDSANTQGI